MDLTLAERKSFSQPNRKTICPRAPGGDVDEAGVADDGNREHELAHLADVVGEMEEVAIEYHAIGQHRPRAAEVKGADPEFAKAIGMDDDPTSTETQFVSVPEDYLMGRMLARNVVDADTGEIIAKANDELTEALLKKLRVAGIKEIPCLYTNELDEGAYISQTLAADETVVAHSAIDREIDGARLEQRCVDNIGIA